MSRRGRPPGSELEVKLPEQENSPQVFENGPFIADGELDKETYNPLIKDSEAYSVVKNEKLYQLVRIKFNKQTLKMSPAEVVFESTDRWEVQGQFVYETENSFLVVEDL